MPSQKAEKMHTHIRPTAVSRIMRSPIFRFVCLCVLCGYQIICFAGSACVEKSADPRKIMAGFELALKTQDALNNAHTELAMIARVGQDLSEYQLNYSHLGWVRKSEDGRWIVMHELNRCGTAESGLFDEGLANFFMDDPYKYEALILIPDPEIAQKIRRVLLSETSKQLHTANYNMLAFPFSTRYQNSNQWGLEVLASALADEASVQNRTQAQTWLKAANYHASTLEIPMLKRLGARMFRANIAFDDHPMNRRMAGHIDTVTVESVQAFLQSKDEHLRAITVK